jgi:hypothetical protein
VEIGSNYKARVERLDGLRVARVRLLPPRSQATLTEERTAPGSESATGSANGAVPRDERERES